MAVNGSKKRPGEPREIQSLYVWVGVTHDGDEGIIGVITEFGIITCVTSKKDAAQRIRPKAIMAATTQGETARLIRLSVREVIEDHRKGDR